MIVVLHHNKLITSEEKVVASTLSQFHERSKDMMKKTTTSNTTASAYGTTTTSSQKPRQKRPRVSILPTNEKTDDMIGEDDRTSTIDHNANNNNERLKNIGKKTRQRLNEELSKRKEIIRLVDNDATNTLLLQKKERRRTTTTTQQASTFAKKAANVFKTTSLTTSTAIRKPTTVITRKKRKLRQPKSQGYNTTTIAEEHSNTGYTDGRRVDTWFPSTTRLKSTEEIPKHEKSNVVQLHGLPVGVKMEQIRKFFTGLSPQRIFMLPSLAIPVCEFDAGSSDGSRSTTNNGRNKNDDYDNHGKEGRRRNETFVERYPLHLRVFVKFQSYLIADAAVERTGEVVRIDDTTSASIAVTPVPKTVSTYIQKYMSIDGIRGETIHETLEQVEKDVPRVVNELLWVMIKKELKLKFDINTIGGEKMDRDGNDNDITYSSCPTIDVNELLHIFPARTIERQQKLVVLHNHLLDIYEHLEQRCSPFMMQDFHPAISIVPTHRMIHTASTWILDLLDMIKKCIDAYQFHMPFTARDS